MTPEQLAALQRKQNMLRAAYRAWIAEKMKYTAVVVADQGGDLVEYRPDGSREIVLHVHPQA